jgi:hypothetical protein
MIPNLELGMDRRAVRSRPLPWYKGGNCLAEQGIFRDNLEAEENTLISIGFFPPMRPSHLPEGERL